MDQEKYKPASLELLEQVTAHMRANGVRKVRIARGELELEVELDPAAQYLQRDTEPAPAETEVKKVGQCTEPGCTERGGHLNSAYCRAHWQKALSGE